MITSGRDCGLAEWINNVYLGTKNIKFQVSFNRGRLERKNYFLREEKLLFSFIKRFLSITFGVMIWDHCNRTNRTISRPRVLIHSATVTSDSDHYFSHVASVRPSVPTFQNLAKQNKFQMKWSSLLAVQLVWPSGSQMTHFLYCLSSAAIYQFLPTIYNSLTW